MGRVTNVSPGGAAAGCNAALASGANLSSTSRSSSMSSRVASSDGAVSMSLRTDFVLDALERAIYDRCDCPVQDLVHHSDRGTQYVSMRYTERLAADGVAPSVGSREDSYDNAFAESIMGSSRPKSFTAVALAPS